MNNNDDTLDDEDGGIIIKGGPIYYDELNIHITVGHFRMGGRHAVFVFINSLSGHSNKVGRSWALFVLYVTRHWMAPMMTSGHG